MPGMLGSAEYDNIINIITILDEKPALDDIPVIVARDIRQTYLLCI